MDQPIQSTQAPSVYGGRLMFAQNWEDPDCDRAALQIQPGDMVFAVTSGADNLFSFLLDDPARVIAVDLNPWQTAIAELKIAAFRQLDAPGLRALVGLSGGPAALDAYAECRRALMPDIRRLFDARPHWFEQGLLQQGGFERYFHTLRAIIRLAVGRDRMERLFRLRPESQPAYYREEWDGWRWRLLMRIGGSRMLLSKRLDPSWFDDADEAAFGNHFLGLAKHVLAAIPARSNYFLSQILLGRYHDADCVPDYLKAELFETIRARVDRIEFRTEDVGSALAALPNRSIDAFALSNVFEYSPVELFECGIADLVRAARPGARFSLRNLLAPRRLADHPNFVVDESLSKELQARDRGFIYRRFEAARLAD